MCFAPQWRALFRHVNFQKCSENGVLCTFSLTYVLRAAMACTFSTSQLPKVFRTWCALCIFTSKRASRHNGLHFFDISTSKSASNLTCFDTFHFQICTFLTFQFPKMVRDRLLTLFISKCASRHNGVHFFICRVAGSAPAALASLLFDPPQPQNIGKHSVARDFPTFSRTCIFSLLTFSRSGLLHLLSSPF